MSQEDSFRTLEGSTEEIDVGAELAIPDDSNLDTPAVGAPETMLSPEAREVLLGKIEVIEGLAFDALLQEKNSRFSMSTARRAMRVLTTPVRLVEQAQLLENITHQFDECSAYMDDKDIRGRMLRMLCVVSGEGRDGFFKKVDDVVSDFCTTHIETVRPRWEGDVETINTSKKLILRMLNRGERVNDDGGEAELYDTAMRVVEEDVRGFPELIQGTLADPDASRDSLAQMESFVEAGFMHSDDTEVVAKAALAFLALLKVPQPASPWMGCATKMFEKLMHRGMLYEPTRTWPDENVNPDVAIGRQSRLLAMQAFAELGLEPEKFVSASSESCAPSERHRRLILNALSALKVELRRPEAVGELSNTFGIQAFSRYPDNMLVSQYDQKDDRDTPYGIVMNPRNDHNGAFYDLAAHDTNASLWKEVEREGHHVRIFECASKMDIARKLITANNLYGEKQKIAFAILGGHGNRSLMQFGDTAKDEEGSQLSKGDLAYGKGVQRAGEFFVENPTIIFNSCSVGGDTGLADLASEVYDATVYAADQKIYGIKSLTCKKDVSGHLDFQVEFKTDIGGNSKSYLGRRSGATLLEVLKRFKKQKPPSVDPGVGAPLP